jgi:hypothetical protein
LLPIAAISSNTDPDRFRQFVAAHRAGFRINVGALVFCETTVFAAAEMVNEGRERLAAIAGAAVVDEKASTPSSC